MFVYQNKEGNICVTFADNKPVAAPEYVIAVSEADKKLYMVSGTIEDVPTAEEDVVEDAPVIVVPTVEELDTVVENDTFDAVAPDSVATTEDVPAYSDIRAKYEGEPEASGKKAPETIASTEGVPSVEELDAVVENDDRFKDDEAVEETTESEEVVEDTQE